MNAHPAQIVLYGLAALVNLIVLVLGLLVAVRARTVINLTKSDA